MQCISRRSPILGRSNSDAPASERKPSKRPEVELVCSDPRTGKSLWAGKLEGLRCCREAGHKIVLVLGHPAFYPPAHEKALRTDERGAILSRLGTSGEKLIYRQACPSARPQIIPF
jgi:hypothetical protein